MSVDVPRRCKSCQKEGSRLVDKRAAHEGCRAYDRNNSSSSSSGETGDETSLMETHRDIPRIARDTTQGQLELLLAKEAEEEQGLSEPSDRPALRTLVDHASAHDKPRFDVDLCACVVDLHYRAVGDALDETEEGDLVVFDAWILRI